MQGKKIVIAHNWSETSFNTQSVKLAETLSEKNEVVFISQSRLPASSPLIINQNLTIYQWPNKRPRSIKDFVFCYRLLKKFKPDFVISHFGSYNIMTIACFLLQIKYRIGWYHTVKEAIDLDFKGSRISFYLSRFRKKLIYQLGGYTVIVSNYTKKEVVEYYHRKESHVHRIYNGLADTNIRNNNNGELVFGFLGRYDACKGIDVLLQAIAIVKKENANIKFNIAGGKLTVQQKEMIEQLGIANAINEIGHIKYDKVLSYLASHFAMIVPSKVDNLNTVVLESFTTATPVIGSNAGGIPEMIQHRENGLLFPTQDYHALAQQIIALTKDPSKRNEMSAKARSTYEANFTIPVHLKNVTAFLETLT